MLIAMFGSLAGSAIAATWVKIGESGFIGNPSEWQDWKRVRMSGAATDDAGNIYVICNVGENGTYLYQNGNPNPIWQGGSGGVTIFSPTGTKLHDVNLGNFTDPNWGTLWKNPDGTPRTDNRLAGAVTKLVRGGDGAVYALMNWLEINWDSSRQNNRIVRINANGTVDPIWSPGPAKFYNPATSTWVETDPNFSDRPNRIRGMCADADGNIFWMMIGNSGYWKYRALWYYDVAAGTAQLAASNYRGDGVSLLNNGWSETHRFFDLEYTGNGFFTIIGGQNGASWRADAMKMERGNNLNEGTMWPENLEGWRHLSVNGTSNPSWGRKWVTATAYDPIRKKLWVGGRSEGTPPNTTHIMSRWDGAEGNAGLFTGFTIVGYNQSTGEPDWYATGIEANYAWHANGNDPLFTGQTNGSYWVNTIAVDPSDGKAWMAYGYQESDFPFSDLKGRVLTRDVYLNPGDQGVPEPGATVVALFFDASNTPYAVTLNNTTGKYSLYKATNKNDLSANSIGQAKTVGIGRPVNIGGAVVSGVFYTSGSGGYTKASYGIQAPDRSAGIRVVPGGDFEAGDIVNVVGVPLNVNGELVLVASGAMKTGSGPAPAAYSIDELDSGGGALGAQYPVVNDASILPAKLACGVNTIGQLVRIRGKVRYRVDDGTYNSYFYVDDGYTGDGYETGIKDGSGQIGIKCRVPTGIIGMPGSVPNVGDYVEVTGVMGAQKIGSAISSRFLWTTSVEPATTATFGSTLSAMWNLVSLKNQPQNPDPALIFGGGSGENIDGRLYGWDGCAQSLVLYDMWAPGQFGHIAHSQGYWLKMDAPRSFSYTGFVEPTPKLDKYISVPSGWKIVGCPDGCDPVWENWKVNDGITTKSLYDAAYAAGWIQSTGYLWNSSTQSLIDFGVADDFPTTLELRPWHGHWVKALKDVGLIAPAK